MVIKSGFKFSRNFLLQKKEILLLQNFSYKKLFFGADYSKIVLSAFFFLS